MPKEAAKNKLKLMTSVEVEIGKRSICVRTLVFHYQLLLLKSTT